MHEIERLHIYDLFIYFLWSEIILEIILKVNNFVAHFAAISCFRKKKKKKKLQITLPLDLKKKGGGKSIDRTTTTKP